MTVSLAHSLTDMGNLAVVGTAGLAAMLVLLVLRRADASLRLALCVATAFIITLLLKLVSVHWGGHFSHTPFALTKAAPSGHASMAMVVYGGVALICWRGAERQVGLAAALLALVVVAGVAITRVTLHAHSPADAAFGLLVGAASLLPLRNEIKSNSNLSSLALLLVVAVVALAVHASGLRVSSAQYI